MIGFGDQPPRRRGSATAAPVCQNFRLRKVLAMQNQFGIIQMIQQGYYATYPLILISVVCLAVIFERVWALRGIGSRATKTADALVGPLRAGQIQRGPAAHRNRPHRGRPRLPYAHLGRQGSRSRAAGGTRRGAALRRSLVELKRYIWVLATSGASAPFIGLFGTVVGILVAFQSMAVMGTGGFSVVGGGHLGGADFDRARPGGRDHRGHFLQLLLGQDRQHQRHDPHQRRPPDRRRAARETGHVGD